MLMSRRGSGRAISAFKVECLIGALAAASFGLSTAHAATFGHSRIVSAVGQPLHIEIPVTQLADQEIQTLRARPAPAQAWRDAGMTPPVALESMRLALLDGYRPGVKVIQLRSDQVFDQPIVDVLIDVQSASGQQRYQVSLVATADTATVRLPVEEGTRGARSLDGQSVSSATSGQQIAGRQIRVRSGDTMFAIAKRNAVPGVTVYQMMMGLQRANPQAFIENNVNLVRADAVLTMPDIETLKAMSDREARRLFQQHVQAFSQYRQRGGVAGTLAVSTSGVAVAQGQLSQEPAASASNGAAQAPQPEDRLRLSARPSSAANALSGNGASPSQAPGGNLLASSGVIATDAIAERGPHATSSDRQNGLGAGFSSGVASNGTALQADGVSSVDPDDEAAQRKGVEESQTRIIELEDNVRHLNEALQKQGHVAAETALEGVRSVGEVIKEIINLVDPDDEAALQTEAAQAGGADANALGAPGGSGAAGSGSGAGSVGVGSAGVGSAGVGSAGNAGGNAAGDSTMGASGPADVTGSAAGPAGSSASVGSTASGSASPGSPSSGSASSGSPSSGATNGAENSVTNGATSGTAATSGAGGASSDASRSATGDTGTAGTTGAAGAAMSTAAGGDASSATSSATDSTTAAAGTASASAAPDSISPSTEAAIGAGAAGAGGMDSSRAASSGQSSLSGSGAPGGSAVGQAGSGSALDTTRVQKEVSWFQENMLAVIGGGLALLVLIVVWLLRRANAPRHDAFESDSPITDTMVREKLRDIDLDLDSTPGGTGRSRH